MTITRRSLRLQTSLTETIRAAPVRVWKQNPSVDRVVAVVCAAAAAAAADTPVAPMAIIAMTRAVRPRGAKPAMFVAVRSLVFAHFAQLRPIRTRLGIRG